MSVDSKTRFSHGGTEPAARTGAPSNDWSTRCYVRLHNAHQRSVFFRCLHVVAFVCCAGWTWSSSRTPHASPCPIFWPWGASPPYRRLSWGFQSPPVGSREACPDPSGWGYCYPPNLYCRIRFWVDLGLHCGIHSGYLGSRPWRPKLIDFFFFFDDFILSHSVRNNKRCHSFKRGLLPHGIWLFTSNLASALQAVRLPDFRALQFFPIARSLPRAHR